MKKTEGYESHQKKPRSLILRRITSRSERSMEGAFQPTLEGFTIFVAWYVFLGLNKVTLLIKDRISSVNPFTTIMITTTPKAKALSPPTITFCDDTCVGISFSSTLLDTKLIYLILQAHCLDLLRQQLMCTVDTGVLGQIWSYPENPKPFVDFNSRHKCKNFEEIRRCGRRLASFPRTHRMISWSRLHQAIIFTKTCHE